MQVTTRGEDQVASFADGALSTAKSGAPVGRCRNRGMCIRGHYGKASALEAGKVGQVVAHVCHLGEFDAMPLGEGSESGELVGLALMQVIDTELSRSPLDDRTGSRRDPGHHDSGLAQQLDAVAVEHMECLALGAVGQIDQSSISHDSVNVERRHSHTAGTLGEVCSWIVSWHGKSLLADCGNSGSDHFGAQQVMNIERADEAPEMVDDQ
jgi:hypothetical protein